MELDVGDLIALGSLLAALLAVVYAKATVNAANKANQIALHTERLKTYRGILSAVSLLRSRGIHFPQTEYLGKYEHIELVEFYFTKATSAKAEAFYQKGRDVIGLRDMWDEARTEGEEQRRALVAQTHDTFNDAIRIGDELIDELRESLRIAEK